MNPQITFDATIPTGLMTPVPPQYPDKASRLQALKQQAQTMPSTQPTHWKPNTGDVIAGEIVRSECFIHPKFGQQRALILATEDGEYSVILNTYLKQGLLINGAQAGDLIAITYHGKQEGKGGVRFNRYSLLVDSSIPMLQGV